MTATDPVSAQVHESVAVVFSRSFRFVEWKRVIAGGDALAFGDAATPAYKEIFSAGSKGTEERWIYAFQRTRDIESFDLKEEIRLTASGELAATPADQLFKEAGVRGKPQALGRTMCLPRRRFGVPLEYRFYASRVRLALAQIRALQGPKDPRQGVGPRIDTFAPRVYLDPGKNSSVIEQSGALLVPVVDPLTVAVHLQAAFAAAADDLIDYTTPHEGLSSARRERVLQRRKKHLLAAILAGLIDQDARNAGKLARQLGPGGPKAVSSFVTQYQDQVQWRLRLRDRLAAFLTRWLESGAMTIAAAAHKAGGQQSWTLFLLPWFQSVARLCEAPEGRAYVDRVLLEKAHFSHASLWPDKPSTDDALQAHRKGLLTIVEAFKTFAERRITNTRFAVTAEELVRRLQHVRNIKGAVTVGEATRPVKGNTVTTKAVVLEVSFDAHVEARYVGPIRAGIEALNLLLALRSANDQLKPASPEERQLILVGLLGSTLDSASALASLMKKKGATAGLSFASGVIDVYLGVKDMNEQFAVGNLGGAKGSFLTAAGSTIGTAAVALELMAVPGFQVVAVIGLAVVTIGIVYKLLARREPLEIFVEHCLWGRNRFAAGTASWSPVDFKEWKGANGLDYQLQSLLNLICKFEIGSGDTFRDLTFKMQWVPEGARLRIIYFEKWDKVGPKQVEGDVTFTKQGTNATATGPFSIVSGGSNLWKVTVDPKGFPSQRPNTRIPMPTGIVYKPADGLQRVQAAARLFVEFEKTTKLAIPGGSRKIGPALVTFYPS